MIDATLTLASAEERLGAARGSAEETFGAGHPFVLAEKAREAAMPGAREEGYVDDAVNDAAIAAWGGTRAHAFLYGSLEAHEAADAEEVLFEALGNAIEHGTRFGADGEVTLRIMLGERRLLFVIEQPGSGFRAEAGIDLDARRADGRGQGLPRLEEIEAQVGFERVTDGVQRFRTLVLLALSGQRWEDVLRTMTSPFHDPDEPRLPEQPTAEQQPPDAGSAPAEGV